MTQKRRLLWGIATLLGGLWLLCSLGALLVSWLLPKLELGFLAPTQTIVAALGLVGLFLASLLFVTSRRAWRGEAHRRFAPRHPWLWLGLPVGLAMLLLLGVSFMALINSGLSFEGLWFAPFHMALIVIPALFILLGCIFLSGRAAAPTWRELGLTLGSGALSTLLALPLEGLGLLISGGGILLLVWLLPGGQEEIQRLLTLVEELQHLSPEMLNPQTATSLLTSPVVLGALLGMLGLMFAVVAPLVEELAKTLVVGALGFVKRPGLLTSFLWGVACGIGFAMVEGITNGGMGLEQGGAGSWVAGVGARVLSTTMHALSSGLVGLGWGYFWQGRRWVLPLSYLGALLFHGMWNLSVVLMVAGAGFILKSWLLAGVVFILGGLTLLGTLVVAAPLSLFAIPLIWRQPRVTEA